MLNTLAISNYRSLRDLRVDIESTLFRVSLEQQGMLRPLFAGELSDGSGR
jgi:predicted ATPase